ncbi:hypothetical protein PTKIN_Ptkin04bG0219600 [Pterospermum kingtungense]
MMIKKKNQKWDGGRSPEAASDRSKARENSRRGLTSSGRIIMGSTIETYKKMNSKNGVTKKSANFKIRCGEPLLGTRAAAIPTGFQGLSWEACRAKMKRFMKGGRMYLKSI